MSIRPSDDDIKRYLHLPIRDAAEVLDTCVTVLKEFCERHDLASWPNRKFQFLHEEFANSMADLAKNPDDETLKKKIARINENLAFFKKYPDVSYFVAREQMADDLTEMFRVYESMPEDVRKSQFGRKHGSDPNGSSSEGTWIPSVKASAVRIGGSNDRQNPLHEDKRRDIDTDRDWHKDRVGRNSAASSDPYCPPHSTSPYHHHNRSSSPPNVPSPTHASPRTRHLIRPSDAHVISRAHPYPQPQPQPSTIPHPLYPHHYQQYYPNPWQYYHQYRPAYDPHSVSGPSRNSHIRDHQDHLENAYPHSSYSDIADPSPNDERLATANIARTNIPLSEDELIVRVDCDTSTTNPGAFLLLRKSQSRNPPTGPPDNAPCKSETYPQTSGPFGHENSFGRFKQKVVIVGHSNSAFRPPTSTSNGNSSKKASGEENDDNSSENDDREGSVRQSDRHIKEDQNDDCSVPDGNVTDNITAGGDCTVIPNSCSEDDQATEEKSDEREVDMVQLCPERTTRSGRVVRKRKPSAYRVATTGDVSKKKLRRIFRKRLINQIDGSRPTRS